MTTTLRIVDWAARAEGRETKHQWRAWAGGAPSATTATPQEAMPMMLRRRLGPLGQRAVAAAYEAGPGDARYIFCSRHGDLRRTALLLSAIAAEEPLSPAEFSVSVHNAFAGLLSIATGTTAGHTAIAAGHDTFACGLVEAVASLSASPNENVLLVYYDDEPPAPYGELATQTGSGLALAMLLAAEGEAATPGERVEIDIGFAQGKQERRGGTETTRQAFGCLRFVASSETNRYSAGGRINLEWRRAG